MNIRYSYDYYTFTLLDNCIEIIDTICGENEIHDNIEKQNGFYYLGSCYNYKKSTQFKLDITISVNTYFKYSTQNIMDYLFYYRYIQKNTPKQLEIMKLYEKKFGNFKEYYVVLKTFWIRIIQRIWKRVYKKMKEIGINKLKMREYGKYGKYNKNFINVNDKPLYMVGKNKSILCYAEQTSQTGSS